MHGPKSTTYNETEKQNENVKLRAQLHYVIRTETLQLHALLTFTLMDAS